MKNREKFYKEILDIACKGDTFSVTKSGEITFCDHFKCDMCKFNDFTGKKVVELNDMNGLNQNM